MSLWRVSLFDHQSKCTRIMTHSQHHTLDHMANQKPEKNIAGLILSRMKVIDIVWYNLCIYIERTIKLFWHFYSFGHRSKSTCIMAHFQHCALDHPLGSKVHGANMRPIWGRQDPGGPHIGPMNLAIWAVQPKHEKRHGMKKPKIYKIIHIHSYKCLHVYMH